MNEPTRYRLDAPRIGPPGRPFGWKVLRRDDATEVERSPQTFRSRHEAMADGLPTVLAWERGDKD
jgi:hypothetical protein